MIQYEKTKLRAVKSRRRKLDSGEVKQFNVSGEAEKIDQIREALGDIQRELKLNRVDALLYLVNK